MDFFALMEDGGEIVKERFEKGVLQAIGFKEFYPFYQAEKRGEPSESVLKTCMEVLDQHTIAYAKSQ